MSRAPFRCPECKRKAGVKIVYGYPSEELFQQAERSEVALGGCIQEVGAPNRQVFELRAPVGGGSSRPAGGPRWPELVKCRLQRLAAVVAPVPLPLGHGPARHHRAA